MSTKADVLSLRLIEGGTAYCVCQCDVTAIEAEIPEEYNSLPITAISERAFDGCASLESIIIPNSVTSIGNFAFRGCSRLANISIPESVAAIGQFAFYGCSSLASVTIPNSVNTVEYRVFEGCSSLAKVVIPNSVTSIGKSAFEGCKNLESITIPPSVSSIGERAFYGCSSIKSIVIPKNVKSIDYRTFYGCSSLISVTIPNTVASIGKGAFEGCTSLPSITIPGSVIDISDDAFANCPNLKTTQIYQITKTEGIDSQLDVFLSATRLLYEQIMAIDNLSESEQIACFYERTVKEENFQGVLYEAFALLTVELATLGNLPQAEREPRRRKLIAELRKLKQYERLVCENENIPSITDFEAQEEGGVRQAKPKGEKFALPGAEYLEKFFYENVIDIVENPKKYEMVGITFPSPIILYGKPGTGKTYAVGKLVEYLGWPCYHIDSQSVASAFVHETPRKISEVFHTACENAPSIIVIDEMEAYLSHRVAAHDHKVEEIAEFLRLIPEAPKNEVLVIGLTNLFENIDPAILRTGRFDYKIEVHMPNADDIKAMVTSALGKLPVEDNINYDAIVAFLVNKPRSDVAFVVKEAARLTAFKRKTKISQEEFEEAIGKRIAEAGKIIEKKVGFGES